MPPMVMIVTGWHWSPETQFNSMKWILWLPDTAGAPYSILTSLLFLGAVAFIFRSEKQRLKILLVLVGIVLLQQGLKTALKSTFKEPRPYVEWLEYQILHQTFMR